MQLDFYGCHPPLKHHPTRARHGEQITVPGGLGRITGQGAVPTMIVDEVFKVGKEVRWVHEMSSSVSITDQPSFK
jgi:hypothetical protein